MAVHAISDSLRFHDLSVLRSCLYVIRYTKNGLIKMLARDAEIKLCPERWQAVSNNISNFQYTADLPFHIIFTFETRVYEIVVQDLTAKILQRLQQFDSAAAHLANNNNNATQTSDITPMTDSNPEPILMNFSRPCHVINIDTTDNHTEALTSAHLTLEIVNKVQHGQKHSGATLQPVSLLSTMLTFQLTHCRSSVLMGALAFVVAAC